MTSSSPWWSLALEVMTTLFLCWSGDRSRAAAAILKERLEAIVPGLTCVMSTEIEAGSLWSAELQRRLAAADAGLVCLTPEAVSSPWLHYEAGLLSDALGRKRGEPRLFTYLLDLQQRELRGPLSAYQAATATREGTAQLVESLRRFAGNSADVDFDAWWRDVKDALQRIPPLPLEDVIPDFQELFRAQTFVEPVPECTDQNWLRRHDRARDVFARLEDERARVHAACGPAVVELYDDLCRLVRAYRMHLDAYFIDEKRFGPEEATGLLDIPNAALAAERRRADIAAQLSQLIDSERAPVTEEAPRFRLARIFAERKGLILKRMSDVRRLLRSPVG
ncbi:MAG TPA: toll/interleukin-1 receptor domain-containing protein [Thermoleophilaceae bacterium]|nr:toll/interleukin-1 receptor domain-containing protein [Thermoleophilaceae bacterium]